MRQLISFIFFILGLYIFIGYVLPFFASLYLFIGMGVLSIILLGCLIILFGKIADSLNDKN